MILYNNKDQCTIYNKYFIDDLYTYQFNESNSSIDYIENNKSIGATTVNLDNCINKINSLAITKPLEQDIWYPAFITKNNSQIDTKIVFRGAPSISDNLGIENAISFLPKLKSWNVAGNHSMAIDWILTSPLLPFIPEYGILFWYKESSTQKNQPYTTDKIPENSIVYPIGNYSYTDTSQKPIKNIIVTPNTKLLKINNDQFYLINDKDDIIFSPNILFPSFQSKVFSISEYMKAKNLKEDNTRYKLAGSTLIPNRPDLSIYISDGEMYSHNLSPESAAESYKLGIASQSYLSPTLYAIYREIYNVLTLRYKKEVNKIIVKDPITQSDTIKTIHKPYFSVSQNRLFKKLAYILSTFPLIDRTTISILNTKEIFDEVNKYINTKVKSIDEEIVLLNYILHFISTKFKDLSTDYKNYNDINLNNGFISNRRSLFNKLIFKYGSQLRMNGDVKLTYKSGLSNGPHIKINQDIVSKCNKNLKNTIVYNNIVFDIDPFKAESSVSPVASSFILRNKNIPNQEVKIPLWDITKKELMTKDLVVTAGKDIEIDFDTLANRNIIDPDNPIPIEIEYDLETASIDFGDRGNPTILAGEEPEILWSRVSGPDCLRFSNFALSTIRDNDGSFTTTNSTQRYLNSNDTNPKLYIKSPGRYVLQLRVKTSFGIVYDTVTVHVNKPGSYVRQEPLQNASIKNLRPTNGLTVIVPNIRECAFGKQGVFWPIYSDCHIELPQIRSIPLIQPFGGPLNKIAIPMQVNEKGKKIIKEGFTPFSITYKCGNTTIDVSRIILRNMLDSKEDCYQCEGFYEGILDNDGFFIDNNNSLILLDPLTRQIVDIQGPGELSTEKSIIKTYGGFTKDIIKNLNVDIPGHPVPGTILPPIYTTGEILNEPKTNNKVEYICHDTIVPIDRSQPFTKGCFHPYSGWLDTTVHTSFENKSAVLKFAPNARPTQIFKGVGFDKLTNNFIDGNAVIYKSSIELSVNEIAHDFVAPARAKPEEIQRLQKEHDKKESSDHNKNYGYRAITNGFGKNVAINDEYESFFGIESEMPVTSNEYCNEFDSQEFEYFARYEMMRPGTFIPKEKRDPGDPHFRFNREGASSIEGIEVKLNFLNYINPKDLVVWLEVEACPQVQEALDPPARQGGTKPKPRDRWYTGSYNTTISELSKLPYESGGLKSYIYRLVNLNDNDSQPIKLPNYDIPFSDTNPTSIDNTYKIYLLNQDHISNLSNNAALLFRDNQDLNHNSSNFNIGNTIFDNQNVSTSMNNSIILSPTLSAPGFSDYDAFNFKKIMITNNLLNNSHRFEKIKSMPIFGSSPSSETAPGNAGSTRFSLCIAVLNETDDGAQYDRVIGTDYLLETDGLISKNRSSIPNNSLCSWELILHKRSDSHGFIPGDTLGDINYNEPHPNIPGYNFIADFKDKLFLLPPSVLNAPNEYFLNGILCRYSKEALNAPNYETIPLNILPILFLYPVTLIGVLVSITLLESSLAAQSRAIVEWFTNQRRQRQAEAFSRENFVPSYTKYSFGGPSKALVSISKDKQVWYKTEASIFRYDNSISMINNKYTYYHLHIDSPLKAFSLFSFDRLGLSTDNLTSLQLIEKFIKTDKKQILIDLGGQVNNIPTVDSLKNRINQLTKQIDNIEKGNRSNQTQELNELRTQLSKTKQTLANIGSGLDTYDMVELLEQSDEANNGIYQVILYESKPILDRMNSFNKLIINQKYAANNNIQDIVQYFNTIGLNNVFPNDIITIQGKRAYHFFDKDSKISIYRQKNLTEDDEKQIEKLQAQIKSIQDATNKLEEQTKKPQWTPEIREKIRLLEHEIWKIKHTKRLNVIKAKGLLKQGNGYISIFALQGAVNDRDILISIDKENSKKILFFNSEYATIADNDELPVNIWTLDKNIDFDYEAPQDSFFTFGEGNYGHGASVAEPKRLYSQEIRNRITPLIDNIDVAKNSMINNVNLKLIDKTGKIKNTSSSSNAFGYTLDDMSNVIDEYTNIIMLSKNNIEVADNIAKILREQKYYVYHKEHNYYYCVELSVENNTNIKDTGELIFDKDIKPNIIYSFKKSLNDAQKVLSNRLSNIEIFVETTKKQMEKEAAAFDALKTSNKNYDAFFKRQASFQHTIDNVLYEASNIKYYLSKCSTPQSITAKIPNISVDYTIGPSGDINFAEINNNTYYWINIDPEQGCSPDIDRNPKILVEVEYTCERYNDLITFTADQICVKGSDNLNNGIDENIEVKGNGIVRYYLSDRQIDIEKAKYRGVAWENGFWYSERKFFLNGAGKERNQLITAKYKYIISTDNAPKREPDGSIDNKIMDIYNLDNIQELFVEFKVIPRKLRNIDKIFDKYEPNQYGQLTQSILPSEGGPIDATFKVWKCLDPKTGKYLNNTPLYYQWLNEMIFRCYFGSGDQAELKGKNNIQSKDETAWVTYDYY